ncbi:MAG: TIGR03792 family protein [Coleofasciculaceae cyanobacterium]
MVIELLKIRVPAEHREKYIQVDAQIWTSMLASYPGFMGKEIWLDPANSTEVILIIRWASRQQWKSIPRERLVETEQLFLQEFGVTEILEEAEYKVEKFQLISE